MLDKIPQELKFNALWCCWKMTSSGKVPYDVQTGQLAQSNNKNTFHSFMTVLKKSANYLKYNDKGEMLGGFGLGIFNGYSAIDIDDCIDSSGKLSEMAEDIIDFMQSYTEYSPSGKGIRIIFKTNCKIDKSTHYINNRKRGLEIYISDNTNKFVTITGNAIYSSEVREVDITYILNTYMQKNAVVGEFDVLANALGKDKKLNALYNGVAPGSGSNESELDMALCSKLAFYLANDYDAVNGAFVNSPYFKSKDQEHKNKWLVREDYRKSTIEGSFSKIVYDKSKTLRPRKECDLTDTGNAHRFVEQFGDNIHYNVDNCKWMIWNDKFWQFDIYNNIKNYAEILIEKMRQEAIVCDDPDKQKRLFKNIERVSNTGGKEAMLKESTHLTNIPVANYDFDNDEYIFNCKTGVVNLRSLNIKQHSKDMMISKYADIEISNEQPKRWLQFLQEIFQGDYDLIHYVQKVFGYAMTGSTKEQCMFILYGDGKNGKSLLLEIINEAFGNYAATSRPQLLTEQKNGNTNLEEIARLNGVRAIFCEEPKLGDKLDESLIKMMTSGIGKMVARYLYGNSFEFTMKGKILMATNHKPIIRGTDLGIWRRIRIIPFNKTFEGSDDDKELKYKLRAELPSIMKWLIDGCQMWQEEGLESPAAVESGIKEYKSEMDLIQRWIDEKCVLDTLEKEKSSSLFTSLSNYITTNKEYPISNTIFGRNMSKKFAKKIIGGSTYYIGIKLKEEDYEIKRY